MYIHFYTFIYYCVVFNGLTPVYQTGGHSAFKTEKSFEESLLPARRK